MTNDEIQHSSYRDPIPFTQIVNDVLNDPSLSLKAKGLYSFMASKPNGWKFSIRGLTSQLKESKNTISTILQELMAAGWITRTVHRKEGKFKTYKYTIHNSNHRVPKIGTACPKNWDPENWDSSNKEVSNKKNKQKGDQGDGNDSLDLRKLPTSKPKGYEYPNEFVEVWKLYPVGSKWAAFRAWAKRSNEYTFEEMAKAITGEKSKEFGQRHFSTMFNADLDELIEMAPSTEKKAKRYV